MKDLDTEQRQREIVAAKRQKDLDNRVLSIKTIDLTDKRVMTRKTIKIPYISASKSCRDTFNDIPEISKNRTRKTFIMSNQNAKGLLSENNSLINVNSKQVPKAVSILKKCKAVSNHSKLLEKTDPILNKSRHAHQIHEIKAYLNYKKQLENETRDIRQKLEDIKRKRVFYVFISFKAMKMSPVIVINKQHVNITKIKISAKNPMIWLKPFF